jgi:hypothetical protein
MNVVLIIWLAGIAILSFAVVLNAPDGSRENLKQIVGILAWPVIVAFIAVRGLAARIASWS